MTDEVAQFPPIDGWGNPANSAVCATIT